MDIFAANKGNTLKSSDRFNHPDIEVIEKLINEIIYITAGKSEPENEKEESSDQTWFEESMYAGEGKLDEDADELLLASLAS